MRWFRFHADSLNNPKIQRLADRQFKLWVNMLCIACSKDGKLPSSDDIAFYLRKNPEDIAYDLSDLCAAGLLEKDGDSYQIHDWGHWQYSDSDPSTERVRRFRNKKRDVTVNETVSETFHMKQNETVFSSVSVSVSDSVKKGEYEGKTDFDPENRFKAFVNRHPGVRTRIGACRSQYIGLIGSNGSPAHMADVLDEKHVKWGEYWKSSKAPPLGLLAYLADGDALSDPPEIDRSAENRTGGAMTAEKIWSEQPKNSGAQYMSEEETRLYLEGLECHPGRKQAS